MTMISPLAALAFLMFVAYRGSSVILFAPIAAMGLKRAALRKKLESLYPRVTAIEYGSANPRGIAFCSGGADVIRTAAAQLTHINYAFGNVRNNRCEVGLTVPSDPNTGAGGDGRQPEAGGGTLGDPATVITHPQAQLVLAVVLEAHALVARAGVDARGADERVVDGARAVDAARINSSSASALPSRMTCSRASSACRKRWLCLSTSSRLASRMSRHTAGSLAAMRVKSRKPGPASDRKSRPAGWPATELKYAKASMCGK